MSKRQIFFLKLKNLSALQDQTPNPENEEAAYLRYLLKFKDLMIAVYTTYLHSYKLHINNMNDSFLLCNENGL